MTVKSVRRARSNADADSLATTAALDRRRALPRKMIGKEIAGNL
jgi:hypothetical protein